MESDGSQEPQEPQVYVRIECALPIQTISASLLEKVQPGSSLDRPGSAAHQDVAALCVRSSAYLDIRPRC